MKNIHLMCDPKGSTPFKEVLLGVTSMKVEILISASESDLYVPSGYFLVFQYWILSDVHFIEKTCDSDLNLESSLLSDVVLRKFITVNFPTSSQEFLLKNA